MSDAVPIVEVTGLLKHHQGLRPLRVARLAVQLGDRLVVSGLDAGAAEALVHLVTGAILPDEGDVHVGGRSTRDVGTDTEWLASLDRFGMVSERAVLIEGLPVAANLALPLTLSIDPMLEETRRQVIALAEAVGLSGDRLDAPVSSLSPAERLRVHLARALALGPQLLLLEHPTARLDPEAADAFGVALQRVADVRALGFLALTEDERFARSSGGTRLRLNPTTGQIAEEGGFWRKVLSGQRQTEGKGQRAVGQGKEEGER